jgi:hypothetical protein
MTIKEIFTKHTRMRLFTFNLLLMVKADQMQLETKQITIGNWDSIKTEHIPNRSHYCSVPLKGKKGKSIRRNT